MIKIEAAGHQIGQLIPGGKRIARRCLKADSAILIVAGAWGRARVDLVKIVLADTFEVAAELEVCRP